MAPEEQRKHHVRKHYFWIKFHFFVVEGPHPAQHEVRHCHYEHYQEDYIQFVRTGLDVIVLDEVVIAELFLLEGEIGGELALA